MAEGIADGGRRILTDAGVVVGTPGDVVDPRTVVAIIVRSVFRVDTATLARFSNVRIVAKLGTGLDNIDVAACVAAGVVVRSAPGMNSIATAEFTVMQILALWKNAYSIHDRVRARDFRRARYYGHEIAGVTVGIIGYGTVGKHVVERIRPFVHGVIVYDRAQASKCATMVGSVAFVTTLDDLLPLSHIIVLAVPLAGNVGMVDRVFLARVRPDVLLVNMARGGIVDDVALADFLREHSHARYATDVLTEEPDYMVPPERQGYRNALLDLSNVTFTPHIASLTPECQERIAVVIARDVLAVIASSVVPTAVR